MKLPRHLAIIMDGNGRWAQNRLRPRIHGHIKGSRVAKTIIHECSQLGLKLRISSKKILKSHL